MTHEGGAHAMHTAATDCVDDDVYMIAVLCYGSFQAGMECTVWWWLSDCRAAQLASTAGHGQLARQRTTPPPPAEAASLAVAMAATTLTAELGP